MLLGYALSLTRLVSGWSLPLAVHNTGTSHPKIDLRYGDIYFYQPDSSQQALFISISQIVQHGPELILHTRPENTSPFPGTGS